MTIPVKIFATSEWLGEEKDMDVRDHLYHDLSGVFDEVTRTSLLRVEESFCIAEVEVDLRSCPMDGFDPKHLANLCAIVMRRHQAYWDEETTYVRVLASDGSAVEFSSNEVGEVNRVTELDLGRNAEVNLTAPF